jgi:selenocysteine lyase/cysteine desulfurase
MDIAKLRADTPACRQLIHLDNAGSSFMPKPVVEIMIRHLEREAATGGYLAESERAGEQQAVYESIARLLGAEAPEIAFMGSATDAWDKAFYSLGLGSGDKIVTAFNEYCANYVAFLHLQKKLDLEIHVVGPDETGDIDLEAMQAAINSGPKLLAISHVPSTSGQVNAVEKIGQMAQEAGVPYLLDACQSVGQLPVNVKEIGCQMLAATGRKFLRGPRGCGFLYIADDFRKKLQPVFMTNQGGHWATADAYEERNDARVFEAWERSVAIQLGLGAAVDYLLALDMDWVRRRISGLAARLRAGLAQIPGITVTDIGQHLSGIATFTSESLSAEEIMHKLRLRGIIIQVARVVHTRLDFEARGIDTAARLSPHYYILDEEVDRVLEEITSLHS